ncbi:type I-B CRISPR-associated protein Cas8b/Csh1 [Natronobeatus ordinarius]|uniref:type I-B CRISPR-associated protein Cas8b/Csh1 n=1 Tax=Natronobeatus ordinarius TaxID=2963433 RepID=UPI0020CC7197|nr:type I-B CRISPR-associated protein Cas8b/Csh1 [Natronobeatus ordinarius]
MLSPKAFRDAYDDEELAEELPDSPIGSLRDIQYLYGKLYTLATTGGGEYAPYLTPDAADDLIDTDDSLLVVRVDVSGSEPRLADDQLGAVWSTRYTEGLIEKVGHCYFQNRGAGIDHSITHKSGKNKSPERLGEYAKHRFTRWPSEDAVQHLIKEHPDGWIIDRLAEVADNEALLTEIKEEVQRQISGDQTALITVQVKTESNEGYQWPADVDVLMEGMRAQRLSKLVTKNKASDSSGEAYDLVTRERSRTVGTAQDPINYYLGKQREKFPGLDIEEAWRSHPISEDAAVTVMNAEEFVEACTYRTFGTKVYYLPYFFGQPTPEKARKLYGLLYRTAVDDEDMTPVEKAYEEYKQHRFDETALRFYVSAVMPHQMSRYDVFGETLNGRLHYPRQLAIAHNHLVKNTSAFVSEERDDWTAPMPTNEKWELLASGNNRLRAISTGWYFYQTFAERDDTDADADDPRIQALVNVLSGEPIAVDVLLEEFVSRISSEETDDEYDGFPSFLVASQFAQLCALADGDLELLTTFDPGKEPITHEPTYEEYTMEIPDILATDGGHPADAKLESFIEETPALAPDPDGPSITDERRGAFLLGALVGDIGSYQEYSENRSTTLVDQYPVKSITRSRIKKVTQETIAKTLTYTRQEKKEGKSYPGTKADYIVDRLRETILDPDPDEWEIDTDDLRFYYALGITYGMNDHPDWDKVETDDQPDLEEEY